MRRNFMRVLKSLFIVGFSALFANSAIAVDNAPVKAPTTTQTDEIDIKKVSESFGNFIGKNLKTSGLNFDIDAFLQGIKDGINGKPSPLTDKEYEKQMMLLQEMAFKKLTEENLKIAESFLLKNSKEKGVTEIEPLKLQYVIVKQGSGAEVKEGSSPEIQYTGKYADGTVFGSSQDTGGPITIPLDQTIPGFSKGLKGMKEGEVRRIFVHPDLGYGKTGHLPPNSLLIFEVELIKADNPEANKEEGKVSMAGGETGAKGNGTDSDEDDEDEDDDEDDEDDEDEDDEESEAQAKPASPAAPTPKK